MRYLVVEFNPDATDNRPLGLRDEYLSGAFGESEIAHFLSESAALAAVQRAKNPRPGCKAEPIQMGRKVRAAA